MANIANVIRRASDENTKGILPPLLRSVSHLAFCAMQVQAEQELTDFKPPNEDYEAEIDKAIQQWTLVVKKIMIPDETLKIMRDLTAQWDVLRASVAADPRDAFQRNVISMLTQVVSLGSQLDTDIWGLKYPEETDAGREL